MKCKTWKNYRYLASNSKIVEQGLTPENPLIIYCIKCNNIASNRNTSIYCWNCKTSFDHKNIEGRWYKDISSINTTCITQYIGGRETWAWKTQIRCHV